MLLIDANNLCMREAWAKAGLAHNGRPTGVIFGVLQQVRLLMGRFPGEICFCWDSQRSSYHRRQFWPGYKANRPHGELPEQVADAYPQMALLRTELLPRLGLPNQFLQEGYEADDLIASLCLSNLGSGDRSVIISSDSDLFQLLGPSTIMYNLGKKAIYTWRDFMQEHGISPSRWARVKAIAGDGSDGIDGVPSVGIKTAVKHLLTGSGGGKLAQKIQAHAEVIARNHTLIQLPWPGCDPGPVARTEFSEREFMQACGEYGLRSLG